MAAGSRHRESWREEPAVEEQEQEQEQAALLSRSRGGKTLPGNDSTGPRKSR